MLNLDIEQIILPYLNCSTASGRYRFRQCDCVNEEEDSLEISRENVLREISLPKEDISN